MTGKLRQIIDNLSNLPRENVICAREPWTEQSDACVVAFEKRGRIPPTVIAAGYSYFLEVAVALEVLEGLRGRPAGSNEDDVFRVLVYYAKEDAFPSWA